MLLYAPVFNKGRILVIGDIMLDRYWSGPTTRISPEAPVPIVKITDIENRLGGAANVALNLAALGCEVSLIGIVGKDPEGEIVKKLLDDAKIHHKLQVDLTNPTITKLRVMSHHQQLIRLDFEEKLNKIDQSVLLAELTSKITEFDAVIISDYAKGTITEVNHIIDLCNKNNIQILVDPKGTDFSRYAGATALTPNLSEIESVLGKQANLEQLFSSAENLCVRLNIKALVITLSEKGMVLIRPKTKPVRIPAEAKEVFDVTGAGDTVISTLTAAITSNFSIEEAMYLANIAAGIVVGKSGTATVNTAEIHSSTRTAKPKIISRNQIQQEIQTAKDRGNRIVFTNGCFDILHAGHVLYLQEAASLGSKLVVAVNSDNSVKNLKGTKRPINKLQNRMDVLAALSCVDWVIAFEEDTPLCLIKEILPDVLVKGGDYKAEELIGFDTVTNNGGEVITLGFHENLSTSSIIDKLIS